MKTKVCDYRKCMGCGLCVSICPKNAIKMEYNLEGHQYPVIDNTRCVECEMCTTACISNTEPVLCNEKSEYFLAWNKDDIARQYGSSGGLFFALAKGVIEHGGVVCGAKLETPKFLHHVIISKEEQIEALCGSKYIPSEIYGVYAEIKKTLENKKKVLFVGTPCQIDAVYKFCGHHELLYTCDLICYGVGSKAIWDEYVSSLEKKYQSECTEVCFRKKKYGCRNASLYLKFKNGKRFENIFYISAYGKLFSEKLIAREACYQCKYAVRSRLGDITLGDYTGGDLYKEHFVDIKKGVSLLRVNTDKGRELIDNSMGLIQKTRKDEDLVLKTAVRQYAAPVKEDVSARNTVMEDYVNHGFQYILDKYYNVSRSEYLNYRYDTIRLALKKVYRSICGRHS